MGRVTADRERWEERHRGMLEQSSLEPSSLLVEFADLIQSTPKGRALDVACGNGRNSFLLASLGYEVTAVDFSAPAIEFVGRRAGEIGIELQALEGDLAEIDLGHERNAIVVNFNFLDRNLIPRMIRSLVPGGTLFFETFTIDEREQLGREIRREFLLEPNEALRLFAPLRIVYYRESILPGKTDDERPRAVAQLIGRLPTPPGSPPTIGLESTK